MNDVIRKFYEENGIPKIILERKMKMLERNEDIASEFQDWINDRRYRSSGAVIVEGYSAKKLSELSKYLDGEGAFMLLIELRENPGKAQKRIAKGFKRK